jgi:diphosphomevalonate decarboxylase
MDQTFGSISWKSPSNIAIVKYWGKYGKQLPQNTSISFTLNNAHTNTELKYRLKGEDRLPKVDVYFEGRLNPEFGKKSFAFIHALLNDIPCLNDYDYDIYTENTFPHSSGIASSASGMSALALCICELELICKQVPFVYDDKFRLRASYISRLGSGSACRSVYPVMASWGEHAEISGSSNEFAVPHEHDIHDVFKSFHDEILIVSRAEKSVSSSAGHQLMEDNPYAKARYAQANSNITKLLHILKEGDVPGFGKIAEDEALTLHALMMCSDPSYILMEPNTLYLINKIRDYRAKTGVQVYFTLDAGPNIHLLYPDAVSEIVQGFIKQELEPHCEFILPDLVGNGPEKVI